MATQPKKDMQVGKDAGTVSAGGAVPSMDPGAVKGGAGAAGMPTAEPPHRASGVASAKGVGTVWNNNQTVNALFGINEDRNSWVGLANVGWVKLSTASDSGVVALTALAAHAYQTQHVMSYRQEDDGMIHEIYAW